MKSELHWDYVRFKSHNFSIAIFMFVPMISTVKLLLDLVRFKSILSRLCIFVVVKHIACTRGVEASF